MDNKACRSSWFPLFSCAARTYRLRITKTAAFSLLLGPCLQTKKVVNNESSEIMQILNSAFNDVEGVGNPSLDLELKAGKEEALAKEVDGWMYDEVCNGVYKAGFAKTQEAYDQAVTSLFKHLEMWVLC